MGLGDILEEVGSVFADSYGATAGAIGSGAEAAGKKIGSTAKAVFWEDTIKPTLHGAHYLYNKGSRGVSAALLEDSLNPLDLFDASRWRRNWENAKAVSPGQIYTQRALEVIDAGAGAVGVDNPAEFLSAVPVLGKHGTPGLGPIPGFSSLGSLEEQYEKVTGSAGEGEFDITDAEDRDVFRHGWLKLHSGLIDGTARWFLDPLVLGGKVGATGYRLGVRRPLEDVRPLDRAVVRGTEIVTGKAKGSIQAGRIERATLTGAHAGDDVGGRLSASRRMDEVAKRFMAAPTENARREMLVRDPGMRDNVHIAEFLARSIDVPDFKLRTAAAMDGSLLNRATLTTRGERASRELEQIADIRKGVDEALADASTRWKATGDPLDAAEVRRLGEQLKGLNTEVDIAARLMQDIDLAYKAATQPLRNIPRITAGQRATDKLSHWTGNDWYVMQVGRFSPVRVLRAATTRVPGVVAHDSPGSGTREANRLLDRAISKGAIGITPEMRQAYLANVIKAETTGSIPALQAALVDLEKAVIMATGRARGIEDRVSEALAAEHKRRRDGVMQTFRAQAAKGSDEDVPRDAAGQPLDPIPPAGPVFSGARRPADAAADDATGAAASAAGAGAGAGLSEFADGVRNIHGVMERHAISNSQLANSTPIVDIDGIAALMDRWEGVLKAEPDDFLRQMESFSGRAKAGIVTGNAAVMEVFEGINRVWKPAQLMRLGWPIRVVTDEFMRGVAAMGAMHAVLSMQSLGNSVMQGKQFYALKDLATANRRRIADRKLGGTEKELASRTKGLAEMDVRLAAARLTEATRGTGASTPATRKALDDLQAQRDSLAAKLEERTAMHALHAEGVKRMGVVAQLEELGIQQADLGTRIADATIGVEAAIAANAGRRVYAVAAPGARLAPRPEGVYYRYTSPDPALNVGGAVHVRRGQEYTPEQLHRVDSQHPDLGIAYLEDVLPVARLHELRSMTRRDLIETVRREFPELAVNRYRNQNALLAAYGAQKARAAGLEGIERSGQGVLTLGAPLARFDDGPELAAFARLGALNDEATEMLAHRATLTGRRDELREWADEMNDVYEKLVARATRPSEVRRGSPGRPNKFAGKITLSEGGIRIEVNDAFGGEYGSIWMDLASAKSTTRALAGLDDKALNGLRTVSGDSVTITAVPREGLTPTQHALALKTYNQGWERAVNEQIGKDPMMRMLLAGKSDDEVLDWMHSSQLGREYVRKAESLRAANKAEWVGVARIHIEHYLFTPELRELVRSGTVATSDDLRRANRTLGRTDADLPTIHANSIDEVTSGTAINRAYSSLVDKAYAKIGTAPTDVLSRHPFFAANYRQEMWTQFKALKLGPDDTVPAEMILEMERAARVYALAKVKSTLYDVANQSNAAHTMRFMMPFYAAWQDAIQTWSRLWMEDPSRLAHMYQAWEAPKKSMTTYTDSEGEVYVVTSIPGPVKKLLGIPEGQELGMPSTALRDLIFQGDYWYAPGFGVPVSVPVANVMRDYPSLADSLRPLVPFGAGDSWLDQVLPAGYKRGASLRSKEGDADYVKTQFRMFQDVYTDKRLGKNGMSMEETTDLQVWDEAKRRTDALLTLRMASNFTLPYAPNVRSPYQAYIDMWRTMSEEYRVDPDAFGGLTAQEHFIKTAGEDYFIFTEAATKSNVGGIAPTEAGYHAFNEYQDLVREMPEMGSLIVGDTRGEYSPEVAQWMLDNRIGAGDNQTLRQMRDPRTGMRDAEINRGWTEYRKLANGVDAVLAERGVKSLRSDAVADVAAKRKILLERIIKKYPAFGEEFGNFDRGKADRRVAFMEKLVDDERILARPGFSSLAQYLALRRTVVKALDERDAAGGSKNLEAGENADLRTKFEILVGRLREDDTEFAELHTRWLSNDTLKTGGAA